MNRTKTFLFSLIILGVLSIQAFSAQQHVVNTVGVNGYDLVSYYTAKRPLRGNGNYVAEHNGATYLFSSEENKQAFEKNPNKYLPAYNGWCAFGVSVGKKSISSSSNLLGIKHPRLRVPITFSLLMRGETT